MSHVRHVGLLGESEFASVSVGGVYSKREKPAFRMQRCPAFSSQNLAACGRMADGLLEAVRGLWLADPDLGPKPLLAKLREQQPDLGAGNKEVREALTTLKAEAEAREAAAAAPPATVAAPPAADVLPVAPASAPASARGSRPSSPTP